MFEKADLAVPHVSADHDASEHAGEEAQFGPDKKLVDLFWRTMRNQNTDEDWKKGRVPALSRLHEVSVSAGEFGTMRQFITKGELKEYLGRKRALAQLLASQHPESLNDRW